MTPRSTLSIVGVLLMAAACSGESAHQDDQAATTTHSETTLSGDADLLQSPDRDSAAIAPVVVDLRVRDAPDAAYRQVNTYTVPDSHEIGDGLFPYEGIGWENETIGYRIYLDERLVADIFGKQTPAPALAEIGADTAYHDLAPWGMDILKVGPSLGIGGIGVMRDGIPTQLGKMTSLSATINETGRDRGVFTLEADGIESADGDKGSISATYTIEAGSPLTRVALKKTGDVSLASGIVFHDGAVFFQSADETDGAWRYIATFGDSQSENKDGLGMALFYRADQAAYGGLANDTHYVTFNGPSVTYGFLAAWEKGASAIKNRDGFARLVEGERKRLNTVTSQ